MSEYKIKDLPFEKDMEKLSSDQLNVLNAEYSAVRAEINLNIKNKQKVIQRHVKERLEKERQERIKKDPDYWKKHQGIGV